MARADSMQWPSLRHKLGSPHFLWFRDNLGWSISFRNWYHGPWLWIQMGRLAFRTGRGIYEHDG
jgi:hypothetical protein